MDEALMDALEFRQLLPMGCSAPKLSHADQAAYLEWRGEAAGVLVSFEGGGEYGYALLHDGRFYPGAIHGTNREPLPIDMLQYLERNFHL